jgi:hypothetical protein
MIHVVGIPALHLVYHKGKLQHEDEIFLFSTVSKQILGPTQPPIQ